MKERKRRSDEATKRRREDSRNLPSRYHVTFSGRVQGVGFRFTACRVAGRFDLAGWVRNEPDGTVLCVVEGRRDELDRFVRAVEQAMSGYLSNTRIETESARGTLCGFDVRY